MRDEIRVMIIDDDFYARSDLVGRVARHSRLRVVGEAADITAGRDLLSAGEMEALPNVILLDLSQETGSQHACDGIERLRHLLPDARILGMSVRSDASLTLTAIEAGCAGVVCKHEVRSGICSAIIRVHEGFCAFSPGVMKHVFGKIGWLPADVELIHEMRGRDFTPRIAQVARLWCEQGLSAREIAEELHLAEHTVRGYVKVVYQILGVSEEVSPQSRRQLAYESLVCLPAER